MSVSTIGSTDLAVRIFESSASVFYLGHASPGSATSSAVWRISRFTDDGGGNFFQEWADGDPNFDNIWDNRLSLSYS